MYEAQAHECVFRDDVSLLVSRLLDGGQTDVTLARLDSMVTKELYAGGFGRVELLLKSLASLSEKQRQDVVSLGLAAKMTLWFDVVCDSLTSDLHRRSAVLFGLTEEFLDYFVLLAQVSVPVPQLSVILLQLIHLSLKTEIHFPLRLEGIRTFNSAIESLTREQRTLIQIELGQNPILFQMAAGVLAVGDYELQGSLSEALCRLTPRRYRQERAGLWFSCADISNAFCDIRDADFEVDCRRFLNLVNASHGEQRRVYTFPCLRAFLNSTQLFQPKDDKLDEFWVDFNVESGSVSFFVNDSEASLWGSIHLLKDEVDYYTLDIGDKEMVLIVRLNTPIMHQGSRGHKVELTFSSQRRSELQKAAERVFKKVQSFSDHLETSGSSPSGKTYSRRPFSRKKSKSRLKVLPLSSPDSEGDASVSMVDKRSRAEILFDTIRESTPTGSGRVFEGAELHGSQQQRPDFGIISPIKKDETRKRKAPDSGYLSDQMKTSPATKKMKKAEEEEEGLLTIVTESSPEQEEQPALEEEEEEEEEGEGLVSQEVWNLPETSAEPELTSDIAAAFKTFRSELESHFTNQWKKVEAEVNLSLTECQQHVSSLLTAVHQHSLDSLQTFGSSVSDHLRRLEENSSTLNSINTQILRFFQSEKRRLGSYCDHLLLRLKSLGGGELGAEPPFGQ